MSSLVVFSSFLWEGIWLLICQHKLRLIFIDLLFGVFFLVLKEKIMKRKDHGTLMNHKSVSLVGCVTRRLFAWS